MPPRIPLLIRVAYDGARFHGVTPQPGLPTVFSALHARIVEASGAWPRRLTACSRTDAGVHAEENLATCWLPGDVEIAPVLVELCRRREDGLLRVEAVVVPRHVFARGLNTGKWYRYRISTGHTAEEIEGEEAGRIWRIAPRIDPVAVRRAMEDLVGVHDFTTFSMGPLGNRPTVRELHRLELVAVEGEPRPSWNIEVEGSGFLRRMVRLMVGTLVEVGAGLRPPEEMPEILAFRRRYRAGIQAPAHGLVLMRVRGAEEWLPPLEP